MKPVRTLILMASEARMRLAENTGVGKGVVEILTREISDFPDLPTGFSDMPGRGQAAPGMAGHEFERHVSEREQAREGFAARVVETTLSEWQRSGYDRLVIAAPPKMLGVLRTALPATLVDALVADLDKDFTKVDAADLTARFEAVLAV